jgi:hypothetical protein
MLVELVVDVLRAMDGTSMRLADDDLPSILGVRNPAVERFPAETRGVEMNGTL